MKLLAISDDADSLVSLAVMLQTYLPGCGMATALSGEEGVEKARAFDPDTILLDIQMPGMDGFEVCRILKGDPATRHIPVIFLTGRNTDPATRIRGLETGGDAFLAKPVEPGELMAQVRAMARIKQAEDALRAEKYALGPLVAERTAALRESEEHFRLLYQNAPVGYQSLDIEGRFIEVNDTWLEVLGYTREEVLGRWFGDFLAPGTQGHFRANFQKFKEAGEILGVEFQMVRKDGSPITVAFDGRIAHDSHGRFRQTHCVLTDITERRRAEEASRLNDTLLRIAGETARLGGWSVDLPSNRVVWSDEVAAIHEMPSGYSPPLGEAIGFYAPEWRDKITEVFRACAEKGIPYDEVMQIITSGGKRVWVRAIGEALRNEHGDIVRVQGAFQDITAHKAADAALRRNEWLLREAQEVGRMGCYMLDFATGSWESSENLNTIFGIDASYPRTVQGWLDLVAPDLREDMNAYFQDLVRNRKQFNRDYRIVRPKDGQERWVSGLGKLELDADGRPVRMMGTIQDITERREAEKDRVLLFTAIEAAYESVMITDVEGRILYVNRGFEQTSGYSREEALGQNPRILKSGLHDRAFYEDLWATLLSGEVWRGKFKDRKKDGSLNTIDTVISPVRDSGGAISAFVAVRRDITRELEWEEESRQSRDLQTIGVITSGVAHEVRNPLFSIQTLVTALARKLKGQPEFGEYVHHITDQTNRLNQLMNDLLSLGRPVERAAFKPLLLPGVLEESLQALAAAWPDAFTRCLVDVPEEPMPVLGAQEKLVQVAVNLLQNALSFSPDGEKVRVRLWRDRGEICLSVSDQGPGIPEALLPRLFMPFASKRKEGTGLGLAIVHKIVLAHGGTITAANNDPGPGATFVVRLPVGA